VILIQAGSQLSHFKFVEPLTGAFILLVVILTSFGQPDTLQLVSEVGSLINRDPVIEAPPGSTIFFKIKI
jgi:hypothetical protein